MIEAGSRVLAAIMLATSEQKRPPWKSRTGVIRRPSRNMSRAVTSKEPGTRATEIGPVAIRLGEADELVFVEDRPHEATSLKCVPPA